MCPLNTCLTFSCVSCRVEGNEKIYGGVAANPFVPPMYCQCVGNSSAVGNIASTCGYDVILETCDWDSSKYDRKI